jgi:hypothetical protein
MINCAWDGLDMSNVRGQATGIYVVRDVHLRKNDLRCSVTVT